MTPLEYAFGTKALIGFIQAFSAASKAPIRDLFQLGPVLRERGKSVSWDRRDRGRQLAPVGDHRSPAIPVYPEAKTHKVYSWIEPTMSEFIPAEDIYVGTRALGTLDRDAAAQEVQIALESLDGRMTRLEEYCCSQLFFNLTGLTVSPANIPGSQKSFNLDYEIGDFSVTASWATVGTNIISGAGELPALLQQMQDNAGYEVSKLIFNRTVAGYLTLNTEIGAWFKGTESGVKLFTTGDLSGLKDIDTWQMQNHTYKNDGGAVTKYVPDDALLALPSDADLAKILAWAEGFSTIPNTAIGAPAAGLISTAPGSVAYAEVESNPPGIRVFVKKKFLPGILHPEGCILIDDVTTP